jgi:hypothetical protein
MKTLNSLMVQKKLALLYVYYVTIQIFGTSCGIKKSFTPTKPLSQTFKAPHSSFKILHSHSPDCFLFYSLFLSPANPIMLRL